MRKLILVAAAGAALAGCGRTPFPVLEAQLTAMKGQPVAALTRKLGDPDARSQDAGGTVYVWTSDAASLTGGAALGFHCTVRAFADKDEKIARYDYEGNVAGCAKTAHLLDDSYKLANWPPR